jgi:hypothetical protein
MPDSTRSSGLVARAAGAIAGDRLRADARLGEREAVVRAGQLGEQAGGEIRTGARSALEQFVVHGEQHRPRR